MAIPSEFLLRQLNSQQRTQYASLKEQEQAALLEHVASEWYPVFKPELDTVAHDPLDPAKRYHDGIFVLTNPSQDQGTFFNVTGDIIAANGMPYEERRNYTPGKLERLHKKTLLGYVRKADLDRARVSNTLQALPRPTRQQGLNFWEKDPVTGRHELIWVRQDGERYEPGEARRPVVKCNEWTAAAIAVLRRDGILCN